MIILHLIVVLLRLTVASRGKIKLADCSTYEILQPQAFTLTHSHTLSLSSFLALKHTHTPSKSNSHSAARPYIPHPGILLRKSCALSCTHTHSLTHALTLPLTHAHMSFLAHVRAVESWDGFTFEWQVLRSSTSLEKKFAESWKWFLVWLFSARKPPQNGKTWTWLERAFV